MSIWTDNRGVKWQVSSLSTPRTFSLPALKSLPENDSAFPIMGSDVHAVEVTRVNPQGNLSWAPGSRGSIEYRWTSSSGYGDSAVPIMQSTGRFSMRLPGVIEPISTPASALTTKTEKSGMSTPLLVGIAALVGIGAFVLVRRSRALGEIPVAWTGENQDWPHYDIREVFRMNSLKNKSGCARALSQMLDALHDIEPSGFDADLNTANEVAIEQFKREFKRSCL